MKGYKAFNNDLTCRGMQYEVGKEYVFDGEPIPYKQGFHFCETIADCYEFYPMSDDTRICEVEATGEIAEDGVKRVTNVIKILAEITCDNLRKGNTGASNSGYMNSGYMNSGDRNSGVWNSGDKNSGDWNSGDKNSGDRNSGDRNSGDWNSGDRNSGYRNSGVWNSGDWNSGDKNSGVFNTEKNPTIKMFDKVSSWTYDDWYDSRARRIMAGCPYSYSDYIPADDMTDEEKENHPEHKTIGGFVKVFTATTEDKQKWWDSLSESDKNEVKALPNFNADKFCKCVGIEHI